MNVTRYLGKFLILKELFMNSKRELFYVSTKKSLNLFYVSTKTASTWLNPSKSTISTSVKYISQGFNLK